MKKLLLILMLMTLVAASVAACSPDPEVAIIGEWRCNDDTVPHIFLCEITFFADGRFVDGDGDVGDFVISGNMLHLDYDLFGRTSLNFSIGRNLTLTSGDDLRIVLRRQ